VKDRSGVTMAFAYADNSDHLDTVTTSDGGKIKYWWDGNNITKMVTSYTDLVTNTAKTLTRVWYEYTSGRLTKVRTDLTPDDNTLPTDAQSYWTSYGYDSSGRIITIDQKDGSSMTVGYDGSGRVTSLTQTVATGVTRLTQIAYTSSTVTTITDPLNQVTTLECYSDGTLKKITAPPAATGATPQTVEFHYDGNGNVLTVTDAMNQTTIYGGYANGNWTTKTDPLGNVVTRTYDAANNLTSETSTGYDRNSNAGTHTTRNVYDSSNRLIWTISAEGYVIKYGYDSYGQLAKTTKYPWYYYDVSALSATTMVSDSALTSWESAQSDKTTRVIETFGRDARGGLVTDTSYAAADSSGNAITTAGETIDHFVYDQAGRLLTRYRNDNNQEQFVYDGLGRMLFSTDVNGGTTNFVFTDSTSDDSTKTVVTTAAGYVQTYTYNRAGDLISAINDAGAGVLAGATAYQYDALGRVRVTIDANTNKTYTVYDHAGRKTADVDSYGNVREYRYDADNRVVATIRWNTPISSSNLTALATATNGLQIGDIRPASDAADIWSWTVYDADGRMVEAIEGDGSATAYEYDASSRLVRTTSYFNKLTSTQLSTIRTAPPATPLLPATHANDSYSRLFYDKDGRIIGTLDGSGYLVVTSFAYAGEQSVDKLFVNVTNVSTRANGTLGDLISGVGSTLKRTFYSYDDADRLRYEIDNLGHVTEYVYNDGVLQASDTDQPRQIIRYNGTITVSGTITPSNIKSLVTAAGLASDPATRTTYMVYDAAGRLAFSIDGTGAVSGFTYDTSGRLTKTVQYATLRSTSSLPTLLTMMSWAIATTSADDRVTRTYYTVRGEVAYTIDGEGYVTGKGYDPKGQLVAEKRWDTPVSATDAWTLGSVDTAVAALAWTATSYTYDLDGRVATVRDGAAHGHALRL
jgi:YD repeat-containing protein